MASSPDRMRMAAAALGATAVSSALLYVGTGETPLWWAPWLAAFVLLLVAGRLPAWTAFAASALAWFLGGLNMIRYTRNILVLPSGTHVSVTDQWLSVALFMGVPACVFGLCVLLFRARLLRGAPWQAALAFPAAWVSFEYLLAQISPHGTFGNLAYGQMDFPILIQSAALSGIWGIEFCIFLPPAALAALLAGEGGARSKAWLAGAVAFFYVAVAGYGAWRLQPPGGATPAVTVGLVASDPGRALPIAEPGGETQKVLRAYTAAAQPLVDSGAKVVVLPEKLAVTLSATMRDDDAVLQSFADRTQTLLAVGLLRRSDVGLFNEARIFVPGRGVPLTYDKQHLLPAFESRQTPGMSRTLLHEPIGVWGVAICKDMDFPSLSRAYASDGISLLLVPAWDFGDDDRLHARMAIMRGVESGFTIARAAREGLLTVSDDRGRILAERASRTAPFALLAASAPLRHEDTIYARYGDWFAWLCIATLIALLAMSWSTPPWAARSQPG